MYDSPRLRLFLFGPPCVVGSASSRLRLKALETLARVAVEGHPVLRETVAEDVWPEATDSGRARQSLRNELTKIRAALGQGVIETDESGALRFDPNGLVWLDVAEFQGALPDAWTDPARLEPQQVQRPKTAEMLSHQPFLQGLPGAWCLAWRGRVDSQRAQLLEALIRWSLAANRLGEMAGYVERLLALDPLDPHAVRRMMLLGVARGVPAASFITYKRYRAIARHEGAPTAGEVERTLLAIRGGLAPLAALRQLQD